eukprot:TRINITY_DN2485_c1_g1_i1.p1 TRINITY_DN2485_c1_g1~~TRINITY_DN2485_c1_g1_i1.p1  ORF type:complete len:56 (+),score=5.81 TRINITY_DN2485_c1_g1_i1:306-473(+)
MLPKFCKNLFLFFYLALIYQILVDFEASLAEKEFFYQNARVSVFPTLKADYCASC